MIELMVVVVIIGVLAVIAVPLFAERMRTRRAQERAAGIADLYRAARTRALGRGAAVMVSWNGSTLSMLEGVEGTNAGTASGRANCANLPTRGCTTNDWGNFGSGATIGTARVLETQTTFAGSTIVAYLNGSQQSTLHVCFSPAGRSFVNTTGTWTAASWPQLTNVINYTVTHIGSGRAYDVLVLPNGTARLGL